MSCILIQSRYSMTDTALGNAVQNSKLIFEGYCYDWSNRIVNREHAASTMVLYTSKCAFMRIEARSIHIHP